MKQTIQIGKHAFQMDYGFLAILLILFGTSCFALYNSFNLISTGSGSYYLQRQIMWYFVGFAVMFILTRIHNEKLFTYIDTVYKVLLGILIYLFLSRMCIRLIGRSLPLAPDINGSVAWLRIPLLGSFQASEFMKVVLIIKTSLLLAKFRKKNPVPSRKASFRLLIELAKWDLPPMILILLQPDTGVFIIIGFTLMMIVFLSGLDRKYIIGLFILAAIVIGTFFYLFFFHQDILGSFISQYQLNRIDAWLNPDENILGSSNQLYTALLSLGSAGLTGHGLQSNIIAIPEAHTDFIFAAFGQCFGLIGTTFILIVCLMLDLYLCKIAYNTKRLSDRLIIIGAISMLFYQQLQNLGMIVGLLPITGITLPLISYGGSSTLSYFILFGIIMNMSPVSKRSIKLKSPIRHSKKTEKPQ